MPTTGRIDIPNFAGTSFVKHALTFDASYDTNKLFVESTAVFWNSAAAITDLLFGMTSGSDFAAGSTICVYAY